jgi:hypothetical protein
MYYIDYQIIKFKIAFTNNGLIKYPKKVEKALKIKEYSKQRKNPIFRVSLAFTRLIFTRKNKIIPSVILTKTSKTITVQLFNLDNSNVSHKKSLIK